MVNMHAVLKTRTSWSSSETSDSSGIGSYHSLNSSQQQRYVRSVSHRSGSETDVIEADYLDNYDERNMFPPPPPLAVAPGYHGYQQYQQYQQTNQRSHYPAPGGFHQYNNLGSNNSRDHMKYATIDRSHFRRNQLVHQNNFQDTLKQRSNSLGENTDEDFPAFPDYKMNLPKSKMNTISGTRTLPNNGRQTIFQVFDGYDPAMLLKKLSPTNSPYKKAPPPPTPQRRSSTPVAPHVAPKPVKKNANTTQVPRRNTLDNEPSSARPGSFEASLQQQRLRMKQRSMSVDHSSQNYQGSTKF